MDQTNSQRFRSLCNDQTDPDEQCKPDLLWISIIDHHQCENNAVIYLYQTRLDQLEQDHNTTRTDHINNFMKIKTEMKNVPLDSATGWHPGTGLSFEKKWYQYRTRHRMEGTGSTFGGNPKYNKNYVRNHWTTLHHPPKL
ncbi:hypothetical protein PSTT_15804 [Puccinia striiformis]|uniref:Uncharacterized protein n=1 Tax=Puccinia striiformis TaxID=27350 RepID=A0A2S4UG35_9BASI|nr:hypothetical protein PSTT_15804 [Puccinia striiformis]